MSGDVELHLGDCLEVLPTLKAESVDAVVTDCPYNLNFMGRNWDNSGISFRPETWAAVLRVVSPGGYMLCFGGTRTWHRIACAIEDGGWRLTDSLMWLHGQGFPKGKGQMKPAWEPILLCRAPGKGVRPLGIDECRVGTDENCARKPAPVRADAPAGFGRSPAMGGNGHPAGRWPANLVLSHVSPDANGEGGCRCVGTRRVKGSKPVPLSNGLRASSGVYGSQARTGRNGEMSQGFADADGMEEIEEWICVEECPVRILDEQSGVGGSRTRRVNEEEEITGENIHDGYKRPGRSCLTHKIAGQVRQFGDTGGASRFFYTAKAPSSQRWFYCTLCSDAFHPGSRQQHGHGRLDAQGKQCWKHLESHPTQKSEALMTWLVKLVCPADGVCLDPFAGSGSTLVAALRCGRRAVGVELDEGYFKIAQRRIAEAQAATPLFVED